jgi:hypothetical protein
MAPGEEVLSDGGGAVQPHDTPQCVSGKSAAKPFHCQSVC